MKHLRRLIIFLPWLILLLVLIYLTIFGGFRDVTWGRFHRKAFDLFNHTYNVTSVEIYLLAGEESQQGTQTFPIRPYESDEPIYGQITLEGDEMQEFLGIWGAQELNYWKQALCHMPAYGYRLYEGRKLIGETSICWDCNNFYVTAYPGLSAWYGFNAESQAGQALLEFSDARLPYKRDKPDTN